MKELLKLEKPQSVIDAANAQKGMHILLEILVCLPVFLVATIAEVIIAIPVVCVVMFTNSDFLNAAMSGDMEAILVASDAIASSDMITIASLFATVAMIGIVLLFCKLLQKRRMNTLGFRKKGMVKEYLCGLAAGFVLFSTAMLICVVTGSVKMQGLSSTFTVGTFLLFAFGFMFQGMAEEVLCRGYLMVSIGRRYSMIVAIWVNAIFFAALHLGNSGIGVLPLINLTLFGVLASVYYIKRDNIWGVGALHSVWNLVQGNFYGIRVSGIETSCTVFSSEIVEGKELINGGAFGLEGGIAVTIVLLAGTVGLLFMKQKETLCEEKEDAVSVGTGA